MLLMATSFSIVIPTKNEEAYLPKLLQSIFAQTVKPNEIIVADANSRDRTKAIAKKYKCKIVQGGSHPSIGRNNGAAHANTTLVLFLDADVILPDEKFLEETIKEFVARDLSVACCLGMITSGEKIDYLGIAFANFYCKVTENFIKHGGGY